MAHQSSAILEAVISTSKMRQGDSNGLSPLTISSCMPPRSDHSVLSRASGETLAPLEGPLTVEMDEERVLGSGQYATVRYGQLSNGTVCAVKIAHAQDPDAVELGMIEAAAYAQLGMGRATVRCFGLVDLLGTEREVEPWERVAGRLGKGRWGLVLEMCVGGACWDLMRSDRRSMGVELFFAWARQLTMALLALRTAGMAHKDIKPHNILLDETGAVRLADFTAAEFSADTIAAMQAICPSFNPSSFPPYVDFCGTVPYSAPEALSSTGTGIRTAEELHKIDVFSLGVTLYALFVSGRDPFASVKSGLELMLLVNRGAFWEWEERQALAATPAVESLSQPPSPTSPDAPGGLARSLSLGLHRRRTLRRRQTAQKEFKTFLSGEPLPAGVEALLKSMTNPDPEMRPDASAILQALEELEPEIFEL